MAFAGFDAEGYPRGRFDKVASVATFIYALRWPQTLKNKPSEYVRLAAGGETVLVTDHDRVVAEIGPPGPTRSSMLSDALLLDAFRDFREVRFHRLRALQAGRIRAAPSA